MKKSLIISGMVSLCLFTTAGCGNAIPEMDEATREMVVEYAADTVRKYDTNHQSKLLEYEEVEVLEADPQTQEESMETEEVKISSLEPDSSVEVIEKTSEEAEVITPASLVELLKLSEIELSYEGYETKASYPDAGEELYFTMNATEGNSLLVVKFQLQNLSQNENAIDIIGKGIRFKLVVNGETKNALTTMLLNDLSTYQGSLAQGEAKELVLVCEVPEDQADQITSLSLIVKSEDKTTTISLN